MNKEEKEILKKNFGEKVREIRENKGMTVREVEANCTLDNSKISHIENGGSNPAFSTIVELARGLGVEPCELTKGNFDWLSPPRPGAGDKD